MPHEKLPPVLIRNEDDVNRLFDHFQNKDADPRLTRAVYPLLGLVFRPRIGYERGAPAKITDHLGRGGQIALAMEHDRAIDPFIVAGATFRKTMRPLREGTDIAAKPILFNNPLVAWFLDNAGAYTAFRTQDMDNPRFEAPADPDERAALHRLATKRLIEVSIDKLNRGEHIAIFPRGTRKKEEGASPITPDVLKDGIGQMVCGADRPENILIMCSAVNYDRGLFRTSVTFSYPEEVPGTPGEVMELIAPGLQRCVDASAEMSRR